MLIALLFLLMTLSIIFLIKLIASIKIVPNKTILVVERLGKYHRTLDAGFHFLFPFLDKVRYKHVLKEQVVDVSSQDCFTRDNVQVKVDGILYMYISDPVTASYAHIPVHSVL